MDDSSGIGFGGPPPPGNKRDHRKFDSDNPKDYLNWKEFVALMEEQLDGDRLPLIDDLIYYLTGVKLAPAKERIREEEEHKPTKPVLPTHQTDEDLNAFKKSF